MMNQNPSRSTTLPPVEKIAKLRWMKVKWTVAAVSLICYINVLPNDFCYDDVLIVRDHEKVNGAGARLWLDIWTTDHWSHTRDAAPNRDLLYRPISLSSYRLVRIFCGPHPRPQHVVNLILHVVISVLIVRFCRLVGGSEKSAWIAGLFFAVMPIHTEVVASVVGRADLLATLFILLSLWCHGRSISAGDRPRLVYWRIAAALMILAASGSKESGIAVVPLVILWDAYFKQDSAEHATHARCARWWSMQTFLRLWYIIIPVAGYLWLRYDALDGRLVQQPPLTKTVNVLVDAPLWQHAPGVIQLWGMYWAKTFWPAVLTIKYSIQGIRLTPGLLDFHVILGLLVLIGMAGVSYAAWKKGHRGIALLSSALVFSYLPTANIYPVIQVFFAERIWYLPSVWLAMLFGMLVTPLLKQRIYFTAGILIIVALIGRCWLRNSDWKDNETLFAAAYRDTPESVGPLQLYGTWLVEHGKQEEGIKLLHRAIDMDLGFTDAHRSLGRAYLSLGDVAPAVRHLQIADMQVPQHPPTIEALTRARDRLFLQSKKNLQVLQRKADANPGDVKAQLILIRKMRELGLIADALKQLQEDESRFANSSSWQAEYAVTLVYLNRRDDAIARYEKSRTLAPDHMQTLVELTMLLLERREGDDLERAWLFSGRALSIAPDHPPALVCRAELLALGGELSLALHHYRRAISLLPQDSPQRRAYQQRARTLGN